MNEPRDFKAIPSSACRMSGGEVEIGDNGENAKSAPIRIKARSGQPIEHGYFGRIVHDLAGMRMHKPRLTIDYAHNDAEVLGYLNHFDTASGDLIASGALTPWREDDRASEVMAKMKAGVPYEASIFFGGDGIKLEEVAQGSVATVNGYQFEGPGVIFREWPLRGVAVCPYGADANTGAEMLAANDKTTFAAVMVTEQEKEEMKKLETVEAELAQLKAESQAAIEEAGVALKAEQDRFAEEKTALTAQVNEAVQKVEQLTAEIAGQAEAIKVSSEAVASLTAERDALKVAVDEACSKLAAMEAGAVPLSVASEPEVPTESAWKKAQKANRK